MRRDPRPLLCPVCTGEETASLQELQPEFPRLLAQLHLLVSEKLTLLQDIGARICCRTEGDNHTLQRPREASGAG